MIPMAGKRVVAALLAVAAFGMNAGPVAAAGNAVVTATRWTRPLATIPDDFWGALVLQPLADGKLLVRNGERIMLVDARGQTLWSEPNVAGAIVAGSMVVFRRSDVVFAVRRDDAGVLWKRPCTKPQYLVTAGDRLLTMCGGVSTVLLARTGAVLSQRTPHLNVVSPPFRGARPLNDGYVLVMNVFDGGWLGEAYTVVDAHTGAFLWSQFDCDVVDVAPTTISLAPYPSMKPWASTGTVQRRRLADGTVLSTDLYAPPRAGDTEDRGTLVFSQAAAYVSTLSQTTYRFRRGTRTPELLPVRDIGRTVALGQSAYLFDGEALHDGAFFLDRPAGGGFALRPMGHHAGAVGVMSPLNAESYVTGWSAVRLGDRVAVPDGGVLRLYDDLGRVEMSVELPCPVPALAISRTTLFVQCALPRTSGALLAFARPQTYH